MKKIIVATLLSALLVACSNPVNDPVEPNPTMTASHFVPGGSSEIRLVYGDMAATPVECATCVWPTAALVGETLEWIVCVGDSLSPSNYLQIEVRKLTVDVGSYLSIDVSDNAEFTGGSYVFSVMPNTSNVYSGGMNVSGIIGSGNTVYWRIGGIVNQIPQFSCGGFGFVLIGGGSGAVDFSLVGGYNVFSESAPSPPPPPPGGGGKGPDPQG